MRRWSIAAAITLVLASLASAQDDEPATHRVQIRGADAHAAARFVAAVHDVGMWLVAPPGSPLELTLEGTAEDAFRGLARASGLHLVRRDQRDRAVFWLGEEHRLLRAENAVPRGLSGGRRVDLDLEGVEAAELAATLGAASRVTVSGVPIGTLTVFMNGARSSRGLEIIARLADARVGRRGRHVSMRLGSLPPWPDERRSRCERVEASALACHTSGELRLVGLGPGHALLAPPRGPAAVVAVDDHVADGWTVLAVDDAGVTLRKGGEERILGWNGFHAPAPAP